MKVRRFGGIRQTRFFPLLYLVFVLLTELSVEDEKNDSNISAGSSLIKRHNDGLFKGHRWRFKISDLELFTRTPEKNDGNAKRSANDNNTLEEGEGSEEKIGLRIPKPWPLSSRATSHPIVGEQKGVSPFQTTVSHTSSLHPVRTDFNENHFYSTFDNGELQAAIDWSNTSMSNNYAGEWNGTDVSLIEKETTSGELYVYLADSKDTEKNFVPAFTRNITGEIAVRQGFYSTDSYYSVWGNGRYYSDTQRYVFTASYRNRVGRVIGEDIESVGADPASPWPKEEWLEFNATSDTSPADIDYRECVFTVYGNLGTTEREIIKRLPDFEGMPQGIPVEGTKNETVPWTNVTIVSNECKYLIRGETSIVNSEVELKESFVFGVCCLVLAIAALVVNMLNFRKITQSVAFTQRHSSISAGTLTFFDGYWAMKMLILGSSFGRSFDIFVLSTATYFLSCAVPDLQGLSSIETAKRQNVVEAPRARKCHFIKIFVSLLLAIIIMIVIMVFSPFWVMYIIELAVVLAWILGQVIHSIRFGHPVPQTAEYWWVGAIARLAPSLYFTLYQGNYLNLESVPLIGYIIIGGTLLFAAIVTVQYFAGPKFGAGSCSHIGGRGVKSNKSSAQHGEGYIPVHVISVAREEAADDPHIHNNDDDGIGHVGSNGMNGHILGADDSEDGISPEDHPVITTGTIEDKKHNTGHKKKHGTEGLFLSNAHTSPDEMSHSSLVSDSSEYSHRHLSTSMDPNDGFILPVTRGDVPEYEIAELCVNPNHSHKVIARVGGTGIGSGGSHDISGTTNGNPANGIIGGMGSVALDTSTSSSQPHGHSHNQRRGDDSSGPFGSGPCTVMLTSWESQNLVQCAICMCPIDLRLIQPAFLSTTRSKDDLVSLANHRTKLINRINRTEKPEPKLSEDSTDIFITPCNHIFHMACIEEWLTHKLECPICRASCPLPTG